jgi:hypothetical protein
MGRGGPLPPFTLHLVVVAVVVPIPVRGDPLGVIMGWAVPATGDPDIMARGAVPVPVDPDEVGAGTGTFDDDLVARGRRGSVNREIEREVREDGGRQGCRGCKSGD